MSSTDIGNYEMENRADIVSLLKATFNVDN